MKHIGIQTPCSEDRANMTPNEKGSFCHKCAKQVHDFTNKSTGEIRQIFREMMGQEICGRMTAGQERVLNAEFEAWKFQSKRQFQRAMVFSLVVVFGLTLFSCSNEQDRRQIMEIQSIALNAMKASARQTNDAMSNDAMPVPEVPVQKAVNHISHKEHFYATEVFLDIEPPTPLEPTIFLEAQIDGGIGISMEYREYLLDTHILEQQEIEKIQEFIPGEFTAKAFPNPTADRTTFELNVPNKTRFEIALYDMNGKLIESVYDGKIDRGTFTQELDLSAMQPGMYLLIISSKDYKETVRISKI